MDTQKEIHKDRQAWMDSLWKEMEREICEAADRLTDRPWCIQSLQVVAVLLRPCQHRSQGGVVNHWGLGYPPGRGMEGGGVKGREGGRQGGRQGGRGVEWREGGRGGGEGRHRGEEAKVKVEGGSGGGRRRGRGRRKGKEGETGRN